MTQRELAGRMDRPVQTINEIVKGRKAVSDETAIGLERVLGTPARIWLQLEAYYQLARARIAEEDELREQVPLLARFPTAEMERRGWMPRANRDVDRVRNLLNFFGVANLGLWQEQYRALGFRVTPGAKIDEFALGAWLRRGEIEGLAIETEPYDEATFRHALQEIRGFTAQSPEEFSRRLEELCAGAGVAVVVIRELPKTGANGAARWLHRSKALIQLNLRYRWADIFWFTFFHEAGHVLSHDLRRPFVDLAGRRRANVQETEADVFAQETLIPAEDWDRFLSESSIDASSINRLAVLCRIDPGIVVGRLQHEELVPWRSPLARLRTRFAWTEV